MCGRCIQHGQHGLLLRHSASWWRLRKALLLLRWLHRNLRWRLWRWRRCNLRPVEHARLLWHAHYLLLLLLWRQLLLLLLLWWR